MNHAILKTAVLALLLLSGAARANGQIDFLTGGVTVMNAKGELRVPVRGQRVEPGDTISTGRDGEIHLVMDDNGLIALRPDTLLKIEVYAADGNANDSVVLNLLHGTFRSVTGWIGHNNPGKYAIRTPSAIINVTGTDHEPMVVDSGPEAGTYDKVNSGGTTLTTSFGKVDVAPKQAGFVPRGGAVAPKVLPNMPALYKPSANEAAIDKRKDVLAAGLDGRLLARRAENERNGAGAAVPLSAPQGPVKLGTQEDARLASAALDEILSAYEQGNVNLLRSRLNPSMIGLQKLLDDVTRENNICKQMRILLLDKQVQAGPDLAVVQTNFQKRCLQVPNFTPVFFSGHTTFLMHREAGGWTMAAVSGNSPFTFNGGNALATLQVISGASFAATPVGGTAPQPFMITVTDPDKAGVAAVTVQINTTNALINDALTVTLPAVSPGSPQFRIPTVTFARNSAGCLRAAAPAQPGALEICPGTSYVVTYVDTTAPSGVQTITNRGTIP